MKTQAQMAIAAALGACSFTPASWDKRFARNMAEMARNAPEIDYTERQIVHLLRLTHKYRRQINAGIIEMALDEMERQADRRVACGQPALPDFAPAREARKREKKAPQVAGLPSLPLFDR